jgi:hypothetical protein
MDEPYRRRLLWHGFLVLLLALLLGFPTALAPRGRMWMAVHVTALIGSLLVLAIASAWDDLILTPAQRKRAFVALLVGIYTNLVVNVLGALVDFPGPATEPGVKAPAWEMAIFGVFGAVLVPALFFAVGSILHGLRRPPSS